MKNSNSSSDRQESKKKEFTNQRTKTTSIQRSNIKKLKTEDFSLKRKLMNKKWIDKCQIVFKEYQQRVFLFLEDPSSSWLAKIMQLGMLFSIIMSCITLIVDSILETSNPEYNTISTIIETYLFCFFGMEYCKNCLYLVLRLMSCTAFDKTLIQFILSPMNLVDLMALLPFILNLALDHTSFKQLRILRLIRFTRVFRLFKISRFMKEMLMLAETVKNSIKDMLILIIVFIMMVLFFSTLIYYLECEQSEIYQDSITSIPQAIWWCVVTMTTVGYGDLIPHTIEGKFVASVAAILGTTTISLPVAIMGINLFRTLKDQDETIEIERVKSKFETKNDTEATADQLNLRELQFMENRLQQLYINNEKVLDYLEESQQLYDELTTNLMSLYTALAEELDLHLEQRMKRLKTRQRIMKIEKNLEQKKSIELNYIIHSYKEKQRIIKSPILEDSRLESLNSMHSRLQSYGNIKRDSRVSQLKNLKGNINFRSAREINSKRSERKSENISSNPSNILINPMEDTPVHKTPMQDSFDSKLKNSDDSNNSEDCDIENKINELK